MTGGNLKALLPPPSRLMLPFTTQGGEPGRDGDESQVVESVVFECERFPLTVTLRKSLHN